MAEFTGQRALITGAGQRDGIGFSVALALGTRGAAVCLCATGGHVHRRAAQLQEQGIAATAVVADLTDERQAAAAVAAAGDVDILVNNAGMTSRSDSAAAENGRAGEVDTGAWRAGLARNLDTAFFVTRAVLPGMAARRYGRIVMISSVTGAVMAMRGESIYATAKAAMVGLARSVALDYASFGITCNVVAPGWIATGSQLPHEVAEGRFTPLGRSGTPAEVAAAVTWFASPTASYTTGQVLVVDGGSGLAEERTVN